MTTKSKEKLSLFWLARTKPYLMSILTGVLLVLSFPPFPFAFLAYIAFVPLLLVMDHTPDRVLRRRFLVFKKGYISRYAQIFRYAYLAFLIWNLGGCYWLMLTITGAETIDEGLTWMVAGLMANLANPFLMAIPIYLFARVRKASKHFWMSMSFVFFWITFEWLHFMWDLSWSWLSLGHSQTFYPDWIQFSELTGTLGISALILIVNVLVYQMVRAWHTRRKGAYLSGAALVGVMLGTFVVNQVLLNPDRDVYQSTGTLKVRLIQPNIDPFDKFSGSTFKKQVEKFASLIQQPGLDTIDIAILPETAIPRAVWRSKLKSDPLLQPLWDIIYSHDVSIMTGLTELKQFDPLTEKIPISAREANEGGPAGSSYFYEYYNAAALLRSDTVPQTFQKGKLVPMVERMPWLEYLAFLKEYNIDFGGNLGNYGKPKSMEPLETQTGAKIASLVCYESEYGEYIRPLVQKSDIITVITNDGWWNFYKKGNKRSGSSGHIQHAHLSVLRAIESRREVARSANTGISLFIDVKGKILQPTEYWVETYNDRTCYLYNSQTFYTRHGDYLGWISGLATLAIVLSVLIFSKLTTPKK